MINGERRIARPLRWGMVGGGRTSQVGYKHRLGALRDNTAFQLVCGAFDLDFDRCVEFGKNIGVAEDRLYPDYKTMFEAEKNRPDGAEVIDIATPNFQHFEVAKAALEAGFHVICEKPLFFTVEEGLAIEKLAAEKGKLVCVTYGFSGSQMLLQMRQMVKNGDLGKINMVDLKYTHGYGCDADGDTKAEGQIWRVNPAKVGRSFVLGDLSTHTFYESQLATNDMTPKRVLCVRQSFIESRAPLEDNAYVLMEYDNGAVGRMWTSCVDAGTIDTQVIRIVGSKASIEWHDAEPNQVKYQIQGKPAQILVRANDYLYDECNADERLGATHIEGLADSWSNIYLKFAIAIDAKNRGDEETLNNLVYPDLKHGIDGIRWINSCVDSAEQGGVWVDFK